MKNTCEANVRRRRSSVLAASRLMPTRLRDAAITAVSIVLTVVLHPSVRAEAVDTAPQRNIMVVPANPTVYSGEARIIFNKQCASCHSQDGRAQTPEALKRHVQDLSQCTLNDAQIIEQILKGTHNKTNTFKMPAFKEKLSTAQIQSLVPLVKAFRPIEAAALDDPPGTPRLAGMLSGSFGRFAIFETEVGSGHYFMLRKKESHGGVKLVKFMPRKGSVRLELAGTNVVINQILKGWPANHPQKRGFIGLLDGLGESLNEAPSYLILDQVNTDLMLFLYAQSTGRTLLCSPRLPDLFFDLNLGSGNQTYIAQKLKQALKTKGIATIKNGERFLLIVPESEVAMVNPDSSEPGTLTCNRDSPDPFPGGVMVNFHHTDLSEVLKLYAEVTGRIFSPTQDPQGLDATIDFTTQTALTREDCAHALEVLLRFSGLKVVSIGSDSFTLIPMCDLEP